MSWRESHVRALVLALLVAAVPPAGAQPDGVWAATNAGAAWSDPASWAGGVMASGAATAATFDSITNPAVNQDLPSLVLGSLRFTNASITLTNRLITLDNGTSAPVVAVDPAARSVSLLTPLAGAAGLAKVGDGTLTLGGSNAALAGTLAVDGTLASGNNNAGVVLTSTAAAGAFTNMTVSSNGYLALSGGVSLGPNVTLALSGPGGLNAPQGTLRGNGTKSVTNHVYGPIQLRTTNVRLANAGAGQLVLHGPVVADSTNFTVIFRHNEYGGVLLENTSNSWGAQTIISQGGLRSLPSAVPSNSEVQVGASGDGYWETFGVMTRTLGVTLGRHQIDLSAGSGRAIGLSARGGPLAVNFGGAGTGARWGQTGFNPAVFQLNSSNADSTLTLANGLDLNGASRTIRVDAATAVLAGAITNGVSTNAAGLVKAGAGRLLLAATNAYDGPTTLAGGTLALAVDAALGQASGAASTGLLVTANATLEAAASGVLGSAGRRIFIAAGRTLAFDTSTNDVLCHAAIEGGACAKQGAGSLRLTAPQVFTGQTTVAAGRLALEGAGGFATGASVLVLSGAVLSVTGRADGALAVDAGGALAGGGEVRGNVVSAGDIAPGPSGGRLTVAGGYTQTTGRLLADIGGAAAGASYDQLAVQGPACLAGGALEVSLVNGYAPTGGESFVLLSASSLTGAFAAVSLPTLHSNHGWRLWIRSDAVVLEVTNVPLPGVPANVTVRESGASAATVSWTPTTGDTAAAVFQIYRDGILMASPSNSPWLDPGPLDPLRSYEYAIQAVATSGYLSATSPATIFAYRRFPFSIPWDDVTSNVTDFSAWSSAPADAWVTVSNGHLSARGAPIRMLGVNAVFDVCFPPHDVAEKLAARLDKLGVTCVRFHHMDTSVSPRGIFTNVPSSDPGYKRTLDAGLLERLDYFIAQLKSRGIYVNLNLHVGRTYPGFPTNGAPNYSKGLDHFVPGMIELQKEYASNLLTHVNAYTGNAYVDEPAVAFVEISNEDGLIREWHNGLLGPMLHSNYVDELTAQWNGWMAARYPDTAALEAAWGPTAGQPYGLERLTNGNVAGGFAPPWGLQVSNPAAASAMIVAGGGPGGGDALRVTVTAPGTGTPDVVLYQSGVPVTSGHVHTVGFWARADAPRAVRVGLARAGPVWAELGGAAVALATNWERHTVLVMANEDDGNARFAISDLGAQTGDVWLADVSAVVGNTLLGPSSATPEGIVGGEMLTNGNFAAGFVSPWTFQVVSPATAAVQLVTNGAPDGSTALEIDIANASTTSWYVQYYQSNLRVTNGQPYTVSFWACADAPRSVAVSIMQQHSPYTGLGSASVSLTTNWQLFTVVLTAGASEDHTRLNIGNMGSQTGRVWFASHAMHLGTPGVGLPAGETLGTASVLPKSEFLLRTRAVRRDWMEFLWETERAYWTGMRDYVKNALGSRSLVIGTQTSYSPSPIQAEMDVVDCHGYWQHPSFPGTPWDGNNWYIRNQPMAGLGSGGTIPGLAHARIAGKPLICTEYNHPAPNTYNSEALPLLAAYAGLQGWDAIFAYNYVDNTNWSRAYYSSYFSYGREPAKLIAFPFAAALMQRGDIAPGEQLATAVVTRELAMDKVGLTDTQVGTSDFGLSSLLAFHCGLALATGTTAATRTPWRDTNALSIASDTGELTWDTNQAFAVVRAPTAKAVIGAARQQTFDLGDGVQVAPGATMQSNDWCAITLLAKEGPGFSAPGSRILVTAAGYTDNHRMQWTPGMGPTDPTSELESTNWGRAPTLLEGIDAAVTLALPARQVSVWALDTNGARKAGVPVEDLGSQSRFVLARDYETAWYEVATTPDPPPVVALTSPVEGAVFTLPGPVPLAAAVTTNHHTIGRIVFRQGSSAVGECAAAPYAFSWTPGATGVYTLAAFADYDASSVATSAPVHVVVRTRWDAWRAAVFDELQLADPAVSGPAADPDGDRNANLMEYACGGNPWAPESTAFLRALLSNGVFAAVFPRDTNAWDATLIVDVAGIATNMIWAGLATNLAGGWGGNTNVLELGGTNPVRAIVWDPFPGPTNRALRLRVLAP